VAGRFRVPPLGETTDLSTVVPDHVDYDPNCHTGAFVISRNHPHLLQRDLPNQHPASAIDYNGMSLDTILSDLTLAFDELDGGTAFSEYGS
jgi:hypothetical protein